MCGATQVDKRSVVVLGLFFFLSFYFSPLFPLSLSPFSISPLLPLQKGLLWKLDFGVLVFSLLSQATVLDEWKLDPGSTAFLSDLG